MAFRVFGWFVISLAVGLCLFGWWLDASLAGRSQSLESVRPARPLRLRAETPVLSAGLRARNRPVNSVALTFSGGRDGEWLNSASRLLRRYHAKATFFLSGQAIVEEGEQVAMLERSGFELGTNGYSNVDLANLDDWQVRLHLSVTETMLSSITRREARLFRPPGSQPLKGIGAEDVRIARLGINAGYTVVFADRIVPLWSSQLDALHLVASALPPAGTSAVVEFPTPTPERRAESLRVLEFVIVALQNRGATLVDISQYAGLSATRNHQRVSTFDQASGALLATALPILGGARNVIHVLAVALLVLGLARMVAGIIILVRNKYRAGVVTRFPLAPGDSALPTVTVLMAARDEAAVIDATIRSIAGSIYPNLEVIVVDDGSIDATASIAEATGRAVGLSRLSVCRQRGLGKSAALNHGLLLATGEIVVCLDADTVVEPNTVRCIVEPFSDPVVGAVSGHVLVANARGLLGRFQRAEYAVGCTIERQLLNSLGFMTCVSGAIGAYRRVALAQTGGFSSDTCAEDTDLALTLQRYGWAAVYQPTARAHTQVPVTIGGLWTQRVRWSLGVLQSMWKHRDAVAASGESGRFGRRALPYLAVFGGMSVLGPIVDGVAIFAILTARLDLLVVVWAALVGITTVVTAIAFAAEGQPARQAWVAPLQTLLYRPVLYLAQIRALQLASLGLSPAWRRAEHPIEEATSHSSPGSRGPEDSSAEDCRWHWLVQALSEVAVVDLGQQPQNPDEPPVEDPRIAYLAHLMSEIGATTVVNLREQPQEPEDTPVEDPLMICRAQAWFQHDEDTICALGAAAHSPSVGTSP